MYITDHTSGSLSHYNTTSNRRREDAVSGIYSEQTRHSTKPSPTPSWRKPDPSQWRYPAHK